MAKGTKTISGGISGATTGFMTGGPVGAAVGGGLGIIGGILGDQADADNAAAIERARAANAEMYNNIAIPELDVNYQMLSQGPMIDPRLAEIEQLSMRDNLEDVNLDPRLAQAKMNSLETLQKIAGAGFTPDELNALQEQRSAREADLTSKLKQIQQQQDMRGMGNSDLALAQKMMESQSSANRGAADARSLEAQAFRRSLDAISQGGELANQFENTDYSRQANLASSKNARELTNLRERSTTGSSNVDRFNRALESNIGRQQNVMDKNVAIGNMQQDVKNSLQLGKFGNQMTLAGAKSGANSAEAAAAQNAINNTNSQWGSILSGAAQAGATYMGQQSDKEKQANDLAIAKLKYSKQD